MIRSRAGALPLVPFAPAIVVVLGVGVTALMILFGLVQLRRTSDENASARASVLARAIAQRVRNVPAQDRETLIDRAASASGADVILTTVGGEAVVDTNVGSLPMPLAEMLVQGSGFTEASTGRAAYAAAELEPPLSHLAVIVLVHAPARPPKSRELVQAVAVLAAVLVGIAAYAAYRFSKNAADDVDFVRRRIARMAQDPHDPVGEEVPIRTFDQVGVVTSAFNALLERFAAAERAYRHDLEQADSLDRERARFLAALSHELRTPLNAILGFADVLLSEVEGPLTDSAREDIGVIRTSGEHLRTLIDDILDLSAIEIGSLRLERRETDVRAIADEVVRESQALVQGRPLVVSVTGDAVAKASVDARRVRQILANLVGNAVKFTREGSVEVRVRRADDSVVVEVADTGPGIPEAERAAVFEEYRQVGDSVARGKGTGLGLAIARRLTSMHEGTLSLTSELGKGSTFRVELPVDPPKTSRGTARSGIVTPPPSRRTLGGTGSVPSVRREGAA